MENLGLQDDGNQDDKSDTKYSIEDTKYGIEDTKYDSDDVTSSPELKRRRLMSDSSSSHTEDPAETFGSPEPPIQMPVPDIKKEFDATEGIMMPTDPKAESRRLSDGDKTGTIEAAEFEADKGAGASEEAPKEEKSKEELAQEERQKMQVLVSSFSEEQLNRYEMYRRSSFPKAAIKRTDGNTGQTRVTHPSPHSVTHSSSQPTTISSYSQNVPESTQPPGRLSQTQTSAQQSIKQEPGVAPPGIAALNPNAALQQALGVAPPGIATLNPNSALGVAPPGNEAVNSNAALQQYMQSITGCSASQNVVIAMSGIAKVFVGEIVEESLDAMDQWGESGPLQPKHIREAVRRLKAHDKIPTATYKHTLFK